MKNDKNNDNFKRFNSNYNYGDYNSISIKDYDKNIL